MVLKGRGVEPRNARGPRREAQCEAKGLVHLSMAPLHFPPRWKELELQSPLPLRSFCASNRSSQALSRPSYCWCSTVEPSSPFVAVASAACPGSRRSELRFSDARNGWTWLDMAAQLAAVVLDMGRSPTSDVPTTNAANYSPIEATLPQSRRVF